MDSDATRGLQDRLRECIGDDSVSSFARRCGLPEATIRSYLDGKKPVFDKLVKIADAAGVTVDWLATGRGPKRRADLLFGVAEKVQVYEGQREKRPPDEDVRRLIGQIEAILASLPPEEAMRKAHELFARAQEIEEQHRLRQALEDLQHKLDRITGTG